MSDKSNKTLGEIIKDDMKAKGINGAAVARKMGVKRQTINGIDTRKTFDLEFLQKFREASGLDYTGYAYENIVNSLAEEEVSNYIVSKNAVTLTLNVSCKRSRVDEFSKFLNEVENLAKRYEYQII